MSRRTLVIVVGGLLVILILVAWSGSGAIERWLLALHGAR